MINKKALETLTGVYLPDFITYPAKMPDGRVAQVTVKCHRARFAVEGTSVEISVEEGDEDDTMRVVPSRMVRCLVVAAQRLLEQIDHDPAVSYGDKNLRHELERVEKFL